MEEQNEVQKTDEMLKKEMIKKVDKRKLKKLLAMCFNIKDCEILGLDKMLKLWADKKVELYKLFGNELKIERSIDITKEKLKEIEEQTGCIDNGFKEYYGQQFDDLVRRIQEISPVLSYAFDNSFNWERIRNEVPNVSRYVLQSGYGYREHYFKNMGEETMSFSTLMHKVFLSKEIDTEVSKYLQKIDSNVTGKVYVSIDPFDFVTMSMNKSKWSSCHSLHSTSGDGIEFGCYSAGIFSYMCDDVSAIAFKTDGEQYKYEFNNRSIFAESKNWRQMVFIHPERKYFICSRQYPYNTEIICKIVREMIEERIDNCKEVEEEKDVIDENNKWKISRRCYDNKKFIFNAVFPNYNDDMGWQEDMDENGEGLEVLHYNDMLHDFKYQFIYQSKYVKKDLPKIYIGTNPDCVICGENQIKEHDNPFCYNCAEKYNLD